MSKFKVGDKVKRVQDVDIFVERTGGDCGVVTGIDGDGFILFNHAPSVIWDCGRFELAEDWTIYNNTKPLSELTDEQRGLLFNNLCSNGSILAATQDVSGFGIVTYMGNPDYIYRAKQKTERELFIDAAKKSASLRARDGADTVYGELFDAGFKAPKVGE